MRRVGTPMLCKFVEDDLDYTGEQLRSLWAYRTFGLQGDSIVGFVGRAQVATERLVDEEDRREGAGIHSPRMLHFIVEHFGQDLATAVARQRLLVCLAKEELQGLSEGLTLERRGDDLFHGEEKLSVSIATLSPVSALIHLGLNVRSGGAPVPTCGLEDFGLDAVEAGRRILEAYAAEVAGMEAACCKVRGVP
ncbi:MAG: DUF366 family protein [Armatimonadota bacterium]